MSVRTSDTGQVAVKATLQRRKFKSDAHKHVVNVIHHEEATLGERIADKAASGIGSWTFLIVQTVAVSFWVALNIIAFVNPVEDERVRLLTNLVNVDPEEVTQNMAVRVIFDRCIDGEDEVFIPLFEPER